MGVSLLLILLVCAFSILCHILLQGLRRNIAAAQDTGLRYVIVPFYITSIPGLLLQPIVIPILESLPGKWTKGWLPYGFSPFRLAPTKILTQPRQVSRLRSSLELWLPTVPAGRSRHIHRSLAHPERNLHLRSGSLHPGLSP